MQTVKDIHSNLVVTINEAIEKAQMELDQIDPTAGDFNLNVIVDATVVVVVPPSHLVFTTPILSTVILATSRENLENVVDKLVEAENFLPATYSNPEGHVGLDIFYDTYVVQVDEPVQGFSVN